jgi:hypothetical protein
MAPLAATATEIVMETWMTMMLLKMMMNMSSTMMSSTPWFTMKLHKTLQMKENGGNFWIQKVAAVLWTEAEAAGTVVGDACGKRGEGWEGHSPLLLAAKQGHAGVVSLLLEALISNPDDDGRTRTHVVNETDHDGATPLLLASQNGHLQVRLLIFMLFYVFDLLLVSFVVLGVHVCVCVPNVCGYASVFKHPPSHERNGTNGAHVVDLLLKAEARGDLKMDGSRSALLLASQQGHALVVVRLLKTATTTKATDEDDGAAAGAGGANYADDDRLTPLFAAAHQVSFPTRVLLPRLLQRHKLFCAPPPLSQTFR